MKANGLRVFVLQSRWSMLVRTAVPERDADNHLESPKLENMDRSYEFLFEMSSARTFIMKAGWIAQQQVCPRILVLCDL